MNLNDLTSQNNAAIVARPNIPLTAEEIHYHSKQYPYHGFVNVNVSGHEVIMFSNNDDPVAKTFFWNGDNAYETTSMKLWAKLAASASTIVDVGAYTGVYSLIAAVASPSAKIYSFEALDRVYNRFQINKLVNNLSNIVSFQSAVSDQDGETNFNITVGENVLTTGSSLFDVPNRPTYESKKVKTVRLDGIGALSDASLIKIDAERAEHLVVQGATELIQRNKPDIIMEVLDDSALSEYFSDLGYNFYFINEETGELVQQNSLIGSRDNVSLNTIISTKTVAELLS